MVYMYVYIYTSICFVTAQPRAALNLRSKFVTFFPSLDLVLTVQDGFEIWYNTVSVSGLYNQYIYITLKTKH